MQDLETFQLHLQALGVIVVVVLFFNLLIGLRHFKGFSLALKCFVGYLLFSFSCEAYAVYTTMNSLPNYGIINFYSIAEFVLVAGFYMLLLAKNQTSRYLGSLFIVAVLGGFLTYFFYFQSFGKLNSTVETIENLLLMSICICYFVRALNDKITYREGEKKIVNWFTGALFIYLSGIVLIWLIIDTIHVQEYLSLVKILIYINGILNLGLKIFILIALLQYDHRQRRQRMLAEK